MSSNVLEQFDAMSLSFSVYGTELMYHSDDGQGSADEVYQLRYGDCMRIHTVNVVVYPGMWRPKIGRF